MIIIPAWTRPIKVIKTPIAASMAFFKVSGMALIIISRTRNNVRIKKITPEIKIQNIVASGSVGMDLNLNELATKLQNVEYEPEQFPGLVHRMKDPKVVFLLFASGKIVITGARSIEDAEKAADNLAKNLKELGLL